MSLSGTSFPQHGHATSDARGLSLRAVGRLDALLLLPPPHALSCAEGPRQEGNAPSFPKIIRKLLSPPRLSRAVLHGTGPKERGSRAALARRRNARFRPCGVT